MLSVTESEMSPIFSAIYDAGSDALVFSSDVSVYNQLEWEGFKVPCDMRPGDLGRGHRRAGAESAYREIVDVLQGSTSLEESTEDWGWELFLVRDDEAGRPAIRRALDELAHGGGYTLFELPEGGEAWTARTPCAGRASCDGRRSAALAACAATLAAVSLTGWSLFQPDTRYMVAIGRWIVENGELPTSDLLTLHEGLAYICQQWPLCIAAAAIFDAFGEAGIRCAAAALDIAATATFGPAPSTAAGPARPHGGICGRRRHSRAVQLDAARIDVMALCACYAAGRKWARGGRDSCLPPSRRGVRHGPAPRGAVDRRPHGPVLPHT
ncbi:MAG: hypothetical protein ACLT98_00750 [Eggerthellaceae bacterium]